MKEPHYKLVIYERENAKPKYSDLMFLKTAYEQFMNVGPKLVDKGEDPPYSSIHIVDINTAEELVSYTKGAGMWMSARFFNHIYEATHNED